MKDQCKQAVSQAIGRTITTQEAQNIEQLIRESMKQLAQKDIAAWRQLSDADRLTQAAAEVGKMLQAEAIRKAKIAADDILKMSRNTTMLTDPSIRNISANERLDRIVAAYGDMSGIQSIDSKARSIAGIYHGRLIDFYTGIKGGLGIIVDPKMVRAVVHEMFGNDAGVPAAKQIAKELADVLEELRLRFNRAGGNIGKLDDWGLPQSHAPEKLAKAGRDNWVNTVIPMLNRDKYVHPDGRLMDDAEVRAMLDEAFITISTNGANKLDPGRQQLGGGRGKKAVNRHAEERAIHFKDSDSWLTYQNDFGHMRLVDLIESHISGLSKDIALVETLGSNPQGAMKLLMDQAEKIDKLQNGKSDNEVTKTRGRTEIMFNELLGQNQPVNRLYANIGNAYRSINIASMLGGTTLASMADQAMMKKTANVHNIAYRKVFGELIYNLNPKNKADRELAHSLGIATQEMIGAVSRYSDDGLASVAGKAEKIAKVSNAMAGLVMRASGLNYLTASNKIAFSKMLMNKYATLSREKDWNSLHADDRALLEGSGIREQDWQIWQLAKPTEDIRGTQLMSAESIYQIPDAELLQFGNPKQVKDQAATNLMVHINDEQGMAVIEAGLRERTWMTGGMRKGTPMGEIVKSTMQFKSFSAAMLMRHGSRVLSQEGAMSKAYYAASLMAMTTMLGGLVVQLRAISNGDDPESMVSDDTGLEMDFFKRSFVAGGGLPVLGDIIVAGTDTTGRSLTSWMSGVPGGDAQTILGATVGNLTQLNNGTETNAANETFKMVKNKIPAQNLWYTKAVTNALLFDQFQDMIAPGYREKQKRKAEQKFDRTSWWGNGVLPERAPDFEKAIESKD